MAYQRKKSTEQQVVESIIRGIVAIIKLPFRGLFKSSPKGASIDRAEIQSRWHEIEKLSSGSDAHGLAQAIIMADKLFDAVLQAKTHFQNFLLARRQFLNDGGHVIAQKL